MKKKIKVLHIASFVGNIGDNANHIGSSNLRESFLDYEFIITEKEIRGFYWKEWRFNSPEFVAESNEYDLIMIGGGNYFELWVENSETGTSIDLSIEYLNKIETPILFYSLGCDIGQGVPLENVAKFKIFLDHITSSNRYFVSLRNDGAIENIMNLYGDRYDGKLVDIPDGGFFTQVEEISHSEIDKDKLNVVINIAGDMLETRFSKGEENIEYDQFTLKFAEFMMNINKDLDNVVNFVFVPHIFRDLKPIYDIMNNLSDDLRRKNVKVAPYLSGKIGHDYIFSLYNEADLILGMRFHSNVCSYALSKNIIGLANYIQILNLYKDILSDEFVEVNKINFDQILYDKVKKHIDYKEIYLKKSIEINDTIKLRAENSYKKLNDWLDINFKEANYE